MTGTISPREPFNGDLTNLSERLNSYESSIKKYICNTKFNPIVFVENSGYPFDVEKYESMAEAHGKTFEFIQGTMCYQEVKEHGKGYGDSLLIYEALQKSKCLADVSFFYKMTGRVFLKNSDAIIKSCDQSRNQFISLDGIGWVMTFLFKANKEDYLRVMDGIQLQCDDKSLRDMEICFWLRLYASDLDIGSFTTYPIIEGNMGETNIPYTKGGLDAVLRTVAAKLGVFRMRSKSGKLFWGIYRRIPGSKCYVTPSDIK